MSNNSKLGKDLYVDLFDEKFLENNETNYVDFVQSKGVPCLAKLYIGHHKDRNAINFFSKVKTIKTYQSSKKNLDFFIEQFLIDLRIGKFDGERIDNVIKGLKRNSENGKEENISLSECAIIMDRVKTNNVNLIHHGHTFPSWNHNLVNELNDSEKEICFDISRNYSYSLFTRNDFIEALKNKIPNIKKFNYDSYIAQIVNYLM